MIVGLVSGFYYSKISFLVFLPSRLTAGLEVFQKVP